VHNFKIAEAFLPLKRSGMNPLETELGKI